MAVSATAVPHGIPASRATAKVVWNNFENFNTGGFSGKGSKSPIN
jgi:hypothetical protein